MLALLRAAGAPDPLATEVLDTLGSEAAARLAADPWRLLDVAGVQPAQADLFASAVLGPGTGAGRGDPRRSTAMLRWLLRRAARDGDTFALDRTLAAALPALRVDDGAAAAEAAVRSGDVVAVRAPDGSPAHALTRLARAEDIVAAQTARLLAEVVPLCQPEGVASVAEGLDPEQLAAVRVAVGSGVSVLTGGPGTGKSRTVAALVTLARACHRRALLVAPTGRAARRLGELAGAPAATVHAALGLRPGVAPAPAAGIVLPADLVVVDEASMLDVELSAVLLSAVPSGANLVLVGDPAQLPSIGPGRVLADLVASGAVPVTRLATGHRHSTGGAIDQLAAAVREGRLPPVADPNHEVVAVRAADDAAAAHRVLQLVTDSIPHRLGIDVQDIQVLTPLHRSAAGTQALNQALKAVVNPGPGRWGGFDVGDRVLFTRNRPDAGWANGDVGIVEGGSGERLEVNVAGAKVSVPVVFAGDLALAWALTVHRAQGSEWPAVVTVLPGAAAGQLTRALVYTAFTRARRHLSVVHAAGPALAQAVATVPGTPRRSRLAALLSGACAGGGSSGTGARGDLSSRNFSPADISGGDFSAR